LTAREGGLWAESDPAGNKLDAWPLNPDSAAGVEVCPVAVDCNAGTWPGRRKWLPFNAPLRKQRLIAMVCSDPPEGYARWTVRLVADWIRRMNRNRVKINWKFDRKAARRKFGYKRKSFKRSKT
jgi:hypothetical protein